MSFRIPVYSHAFILTFLALACAIAQEPPVGAPPTNAVAVPADSLPSVNTPAAPALTPTVETTPAVAATPELSPTATPKSIPKTVPLASPATKTSPEPSRPVAAMQKPAPESSTGERSSYSSVHVDGPYIAMTFDDGPSAALTPRLLDILKERHIHVTFFVLGQMVQAHPEILQREVAEGHEIGNHTWDHLSLMKVVSREGGLNHELADTSALIKQVTGKPPSIMRPPYGATSPRLSRAIEKEFGMKVILWSVDPDDWKDPGAHVVQQRIISGWKDSGGAKPGAIILSHDIHKGTIEAMPATLDELLAKGYKFVTVSELLAMEKKASATATSSPAPVLKTNATSTNSSKTTN